MTVKDLVADSGDGHTESGPPRVMKRCSMKMCQTEYGKGIEGEGRARQKDIRVGRVGFVLLPAFQ